MTDREIFQDNLNYYLKKYKRLQKDLAEYVGAKTTTVSGWTRGVSYPRADAMEKIAMFFGIPTSHLVGDRNNSSAERSKLVIADSDLFRRIIMNMEPEDYKTVMQIFEKTEMEMKKRGQL